MLYYNIINFKHDFSIFSILLTQIKLEKLKLESNNSNN